MITKDSIKTLVDKWLEEHSDYFFVDLQIEADDRIVIEIDCADGVWIEDCAALSRFLQEQVGEDEIGQYELEVGSAGLGQPFKVEMQYHNHVGDQVEVIGLDGLKTTGTLIKVEGRNFTVATQEKQVPEGKKRPVKVDVEREFQMDSIKSCKLVLKFK